MSSNLKWSLAGGAIMITLVIGLAVVQVQSSDVGLSADPMSADQSQAQQATGRVTMIDLGATNCVPCKMMAPIIEELKQEYAGKADIIFIDVWKNPDQAKKYGIQAIPTQIFFDAQGREVGRHVGFMDKKRIVQELTKLGVF